MATVLLLILLALAAPAGAAGPQAPAAAPQPDQPDIRTEAGLRTALDQLEARYEAGAAKLGEASWDAMMGVAGADQRLEEARRLLAGVFADPGLARIQSVWAMKRTVTAEPSLSRRVLLWERARLEAGVALDPEIFGLTQSLAAKLRGHRYTLDGRAATRAELDRILATSPDRDLRRRAWMAEAAFAGEVGPEVKRLIRLRALKAQPTDLLYFHHIVYAGRELEAYWAYGLMQQTATATRPQYDRLLASLKTAIGQESLEPWDLEYALTARTTQRGLDKAIAAAFPAGGALDAARRLLAALGFDVDRLPIRAVSGAIGSGETLAVAARIPGDIRILADGASQAGGPRYYESVFEAFGRALPWAFNAQKAPMLKGYETLAATRNGVYAEGMAEALGAFVRDPIFLEKTLGMDRKSIDLFLEDERDRALVGLRRLLLDMGIEFAFYVNPDADLDGRYRQLMARSLGVSAPTGAPAPWPARIGFVTSPAADLDRIIALSIAPEVQARLREAFGDRRLGPGKAAPWLIEHCFADGELVALQDRLSGSIHGGMDFQRYLNTVGLPPAAARP